MINLVHFTLFWMVSCSQGLCKTESEWRLFGGGSHLCNLEVVLDPRLLQLGQAFLHSLRLAHLIIRNNIVRKSIFFINSDFGRFYTCRLWTVSSHLTALTNRLCFILFRHLYASPMFKSISSYPFNCIWSHIAIFPGGFCSFTFPLNIALLVLSCAKVKSNIVFFSPQRERISLFQPWVQRCTWGVCQTWGSCSSTPPQPDQENCWAKKW